MGVAPEVLAMARAHIEEANRLAVVEVWPENWHALLVLIAMGTQWARVAVASGPVRYQGLVYASLPLVLAAVRPRIPAELRRPLHELMAQLRAMEACVLEIRNAD